jgi:hypothetical protein
VSEPTARVTLVTDVNPLLSAAVRMISYENVPTVPWFSATRLPLAPTPVTNVCTCVLWWSRTVQANALPGRGPSSGSMAIPWKVICCPGSTVAPFDGDRIVGMGGRLPTTTSTVIVALNPAVLVTVNRATYLVSDAAA